HRVQPQRRQLGLRGCDHHLAPPGSQPDPHRPSRWPRRDPEGDSMTLRTDPYEADVIRSADGSTLRETAPDAAQTSASAGAAPCQHREGPPPAANAAALLAVFEARRPRLIGESTTSVGTGDRLGLATAGQARAFREQGQGTVPVLAQQSIREMDRLSREAR